MARNKPQTDADTQQLTLDLDPRMHERFGSLRECVAQGIYQRGLTKVAPSLDKAPGNLSVELSEDPTRKFGIDSLERYIEAFNDLQPVYYLVSKFLKPDEAPREPALPAEVLDLLARMAPALKRAGLA